jgi:hypothetical protein
MSRYEPGTGAWWAETAFITLLGLWVAASLWDNGADETRADAERAGAAEGGDAPRFETFADIVEAGCLTAADLRAMREGQRPALTVCREMAQPR